MYSENSLNKVTKTGGYQLVKKPHFNIFGFTQVDHLIDISRDRIHIKDGFIQRFMLCIPKDVYLFKKDVKKSMGEVNNCVDMRNLLEQIFDKCFQKEKKVGYIIVDASEVFY